MKMYNVTINFGGYIGSCDEEYLICADSKEEAKKEALQKAMHDLYCMEIECIDEEDE